jgi:hypothetical protein
MEMVACFFKAPMPLGNVTGLVKSKNLKESVCISNNSLERVESGSVGLSKIEAIQAGMLSTFTIAAVAVGPVPGVLDTVLIHHTHLYGVIDEFMAVEVVEVNPLNRPLHRVIGFHQVGDTTLSILQGAIDSNDLPMFH